MKAGEKWAWFAGIHKSDIANCHTLYLNTITTFCTEPTDFECFAGTNGSYLGQEEAKTYTMN